MRLARIQFTYFFNGLMERPDQRYITINNRLNNLFNGFPTILPYSIDMPVDFPFVQLKSSDGKYSLNLAKSRCDFIINYPLISEIEKELTQYYTLLNNLTTELSNIKFARIGMVGGYIIEDENAIKFINDKFIKKDLSDSFELMLRFNRRKKWSNTQLNDVLNISNVNYSLDGKIKQGIHVERDINTIPELQLNITKKDVDVFINYIKECFAEVSILEIIK